MGRYEAPQVRGLETCNVPTLSRHALIPFFLRTEIPRVKRNSPAPNAYSRSPRACDAVSRYIHLEFKCHNKLKVFKVFIRIIATFRRLLTFHHMHESVHALTLLILRSAEFLFFYISIYCPSTIGQICLRCFSNVPFFRPNDNRTLRVHPDYSYQTNTNDMVCKASVKSTISYICGVAFLRSCPKPWQRSRRSWWWWAWSRERVGCTRRRTFWNIGFYRKWTMTLYLVCLAVLVIRTNVWYHVSYVVQSFGLWMWYVCPPGHGDKLDVQTAILRHLSGCPHGGEFDVWSVWC